MSWFDYKGIYLALFAATHSAYIAFSTGFEKHPMLFLASILWFIVITIVGEFLIYHIYMDLSELRKKYYGKTFMLKCSLVLQPLILAIHLI